MLSIQSFKRGMPLVPSGQPGIIIDAGERAGVKNWARFQPGGFRVGALKSLPAPGLVGRTKFRLSDYMRVFLHAIGEAPAV